MSDDDEELELEQDREELEGLSRGEMLTLAQSWGVTVEPGATSDELVEALLPYV